MRILHKANSTTHEDIKPVPVFRFFNTIRGGYFYTISETERDEVIPSPRLTYEGINLTLRKIDKSGRDYRSKGYKISGDIGRVYVVMNMLFQDFHM